MANGIKSDERKFIQGLTRGHMTSNRTLFSLFPYERERTQELQC